MTTRTFITVFLIVLIYPISELHNLWYNRSEPINIWIARDYPLGIEWFVKFLTDRMNDVIKAVIVFRLARMNHTLRIASKVYLLYVSTELVFFFIDFNRSGWMYTLIYSLIGLVTVLVSYQKKGMMTKELKISNL